MHPGSVCHSVQHQCRTSISSLSFIGLATGLAGQRRKLTSAKWMPSIPKQPSDLPVLDTDLSTWMHCFKRAELYHFLLDQGLFVRVIWLPHTVGALIRLQIFSFYKNRPECMEAKKGGVGKLLLVSKQNDETVRCPVMPLPAYP